MSQIAPQISIDLSMTLLLSMMLLGTDGVPRRKRFLDLQNNIRQSSDRIHDKASVLSSCGRMKNSQEIEVDGRAVDSDRGTCWSR
jgi:hypothetical protein